MNSCLGTLVADAGRQLGSAWRNRDFDESAFPELAQAALAESGLHRVLNFASLTEWLICARSLPAPGPNMGGSFGEPAVTLYSESSGGCRFTLEALVWMDGTTTIHDHGFSGAFMVAQGSSLHSRYDFTESDRIRTDLLIGNVRWRSSELLERGDIRKIEAGSQFIHSLFHLNRPSLTLVIRTDFDRNVIQYNYEPPRLAVNPFLSAEPLATQLRMLEALRSDSDAFWKMVELLLSDADLWSTRRVLDYLHEQRAELADWSHILETATERHGQHRIAALLDAATEKERAQNICRLRHTVRQPDHRFFMALLLNVPDRSAILRLIADRYPEADPIQQALIWLQELSSDSSFGLTITPQALLMLYMTMQGASLADVCARFRQVATTTETYFGQQTPHELWAKLHAEPLLRPLLLGEAVHDECHVGVS